ncbi:YciI family protein [Streptomyces sp. UNOC14_S4]|uniref:YciI family protein n=1 Tax=Streptomyces sp. UNOC14_S4 TaxID=2872340 RepID=UPI001E5E4BD6|nr:YciI family protein [Streptomyces sp. UNOC14_S4]MCC3768874.1 YciI family protein [Streptomyces sp. UNOC14_S4]
MPVFVVEFTYNVDREEREKAHADHADYLKGLTDSGVLLAAGPLADANAGLLVYALPDRAALDEVLHEEPYAKAGFIAATRVREWRPGKGVWAAGRA